LVSSNTLLRGLHNSNSVFTPYSATFSIVLALGTSLYVIFNIALVFPFQPFRHPANPDS